MAQAQGDAPGPDLAAGVPADDVLEGAPLLGHVGEEAVVLVRSGGRLFAVGATCTHYGGPLAEGLVIDGTIRCPWHHACFDLATGERLRAPALAPIACYRVETDGGRVRVGERLADPGRARGPRVRRPPSSWSARGRPAYAAADALRREGFAGQVTLLGAEDTGPVDRPNLSKDYLAGKAPEEWIPLAMPADVETAHRRARRRDRHAGAQRPPGRRVGRRAGMRCCLATGADVIRLEVPGADLLHVHTLRTLADSRSIAAASGSARRAVVVGAGFIGLEVAASLRERGVGVDVVAPSPRWARSWARRSARSSRSCTVSTAWCFHIGDGVASIAPDGVRLTSGVVLPADLVVVGIGVRPATSLAERAGLRLDRGILVDDRLETSAPGVFAAGDVARWSDPRFGGPIRVEHWVVAERMGAAVARSILGRTGALPRRALLLERALRRDVRLRGPRRALGPHRRARHRRRPRRHARLSRGELTRAVVTVGRDRVSLEAELAFERDDQGALAAFGRRR